MTKKFSVFFYIAALSIVVVLSCTKTKKSNADLTKNYFPIAYGKYVTYDVDSFYYGIYLDTLITGQLDTVSSIVEVKSQMKLCITDTTRDKDDSLIYLVSVFYRHYDGDFWQKEGSVLYLRANSDSIIINQDGNKYIKLKFPIVNNYSWKGNSLVDIHNPPNAYLANWNYTYKDLGLTYNNNLHNFQNTVTVYEDDESVNYPYVDSALQAYRIYAKEVYAYNIGMVYKEWTHWVYYPNSIRWISGYTVIMRAVDYN